MTDDQILEVVQAHKEGKQIQWRHRDGKGNPTDWYTPADGYHPNWDFSFYEYRVAPEPRKPREWRVFVSGGEIQSCLTRDPCLSPQGPILVREVLENE